VSSAAVDTIRVGAASVRVLVFGGGATLCVLDPVTGAVLAKQDLDSRSPQGADGQQIDIESSPLIAHFADGSDWIVVGMDVHNRARTSAARGCTRSSSCRPRAAPRPTSFSSSTSSIPRRGSCGTR
jgi:hypothetical protein